MKMRIEKDSLGEVKVPEDALYGAQTQRAIDNFTISPQALPLAFIRTLLMVKKAAAISNQDLNVLDKDIAEAIIKSCDELSKDPELASHFPVNVYQTGSGTSTNMNANEVIANTARRYTEKVVHPNDHVNYGQSSNDVIPTSIHISAAIALDDKLIPALDSAIGLIQKKASSLDGIIKTGRTHLMDAMPISLSQSVNAWADQLALCKQHLRSLQPSLLIVAQGGTAVGTGINTHTEFATHFAANVSQLSGLNFSAAKSAFMYIATQDTAVTISSQLKTLAVALIKIANDLRWMNSGPLAGLGEISLPALQPGSSIMPGKVNPVIPEAVLMACTQAIANDTAITLAGQSGNFELNVMLPLVAQNLLQSIDLLSDSLDTLTNDAITGFHVNQQAIDHALTRNPILVTALNPIIGYEKAAFIAKRAYKEKRPIIDVAAEETSIGREELEALLDPKKLV